MTSWNPGDPPDPSGQPGSRPSTGSSRLPATDSRRPRPGTGSSPRHRPGTGSSRLRATGSRRPRLGTGSSPASARVRAAATPGYGQPPPPPGYGQPYGAPPAYPAGPNPYGGQAPLLPGADRSAEHGQPGRRVHHRLGDLRGARHRRARRRLGAFRLVVDLITLAVRIYFVYLIGSPSVRRPGRRSWASRSSTRTPARPSGSGAPRARGRAGPLQHHLLRRPVVGLARQQLRDVSRLARQGARRPGSSASSSS